MHVANTTAPLQVFIWDCCVHVADTTVPLQVFVWDCRVHVADTTVPLQIFTAAAVGALGLSSNSSLRALASKNVGVDGQGTVMATLGVVENLSKVLGPLLHTAISVTTRSFCQPLVFYVLAAEAGLVLAIVTWVKCQRQGADLLHP